MKLVGSYTESTLIRLIKNQIPSSLKIEREVSFMQITIDELIAQAQSSFKSIALSEANSFLKILGLVTQ